MKFMLAALLLLSSAAFADQPVQSVKEIDNTAVLCITPGDAGRVAYRPEKIKVARERERVVFTFDLRALRCVFSAGEGMKLVPRTLNASYPGHAADGTPVVYNIIRSESMLITRDFELVVPSLGLFDVELQSLSLVFDLDKVLDANQLKDYESGAAVGVRLEYYNLVTQTVTHKGENVSLGSHAWGSYFFDFTFQK